MVAITCYVADFNLVPGFPVITDLTLNGLTLGSYLGEASGAAAIDLTMDFSRRDHLPGLVDSTGVKPDQMMEALPHLLGVGTPGAAPAIGLLLADSCVDAPSQFGLMFDLHGKDGTLGPRQGCAIFLTAIAAAVPNNDLDQPGAREFIALTAVHEIGHAMNLWHVHNDSIMQPHPDPSNLGNLTFDAKEADYLSLASNPEMAPFVIPGVGCSPYGTRPSGYPGGDDQPFASPARRDPSGLTLRIGLSNASFWPFEPVELDVELSLPKGRTKAVKIPDEIDPGYAAFQIWITRPDGVRFRYHAAARYCGQNGVREVMRGQPYTRDIAITRQSHGYTFVAPGRHQVQVAFRAGRGQFTMSNIVECEVRAPAPDSPDWVMAAASLDNFEAQHLLQYKRRLPSLSSYTQMVKFANEKASEATAAAINFALGKAVARSHRTAEAGHASRLRAHSALHLEKAVASSALGKRREHIAKSLLEGLSKIAS